MSNNRKTLVLSNFAWRFAERCGAQLVTGVVSILLARILLPEDYGMIALVTVFTNIMQVFVDSGLGTALIQKKDADELDFSSVFYFNFAVCLVLYAGMFIAAPYIAAFYKNMALVPVIRVISLTVVISGIKGIQQAYVSRNMLFKRFFFATLGGTLFSAAFGMVLAYNGFGVWALVAQQLSNTAIDTLILWCTVHWRPKRMFSWHRLESLLSYGWKLLASSLLDSVYNNLRSLLIGRVYTSADLAYYNQGEIAPNAVAVNVDSSIDSVLFPAMSAAQDDPAQVKNMTRNAIKMSVYVIAPLMMSIAFCADTLVRLILTEKWLPCVPFLRIFCVTYMFYPIHTANLNAIKAMGRSDLYLKLEIAKKIVGLTLLLLTFRISVMAMGYSLFAAEVLCQLINSWPNKRLLNYRYLEQLKDILPAIGLAVGAGGCMGLVQLLGLADLPTLLLQLLLGSIVYCTASALLKIDEFSYILNIVKAFLKIDR